MHRRLDTEVGRCCSLISHTKQHQSAIRSSCTVLQTGMLPFQIIRDGGGGGVICAQPLGTVGSDYYLFDGPVLGFALVRHGLSRFRFVFESVCFVLRPPQKVYLSEILLRVFVWVRPSFLPSSSFLYSPSKHHVCLVCDTTGWTLVASFCEQQQLWREREKRCQQLLFYEKLR